MAAAKGNQYAKGNKGGTGAPPKYRPEFVEQARKACEAGFTDRELAVLFDVDERTIEKWKAKHQDFRAALKIGKSPVDDEVERSLYLSARGYSHPAVHIHVTKTGRVIKTDYIQHYPPHPTSMVYWLKNRRPEAWRDKHEGAEGDGESGITITVKGGLPKKE